MWYVMCRQHGDARRRQRWLHGVATRAGWPTGDDRQSRVRAGLSLLRVLPAAPVAWLARLEAAWCTLDLRDERRSGVAMGLSPYGCTRMVAELLLGRPPRTCSPQIILILPLCYCPICPIKWDRVQLNWTWFFSRITLGSAGIGT
jgi:hypothetical protein